MQFSALRCSIREQRFKELHRSGDHYGRIPAFHGQSQLVSVICLAGFAGRFDFFGQLVTIKSTVMLKHRIFVLTHGLAKYIGGLLNDAGEWDDINHAA